MTLCICLILSIRLIISDSPSTLTSLADQIRRQRRTSYLIAQSHAIASDRLRAAVASAARISVIDIDNCLEKYFVDRRTFLKTAIICMTLNCAFDESNILNVQRIVGHGS